MKRRLAHKWLTIIPVIIFITVISAFNFIDFSIDSKSEISFQKGEKIEFRIHYGLVNAGEATMLIDNKPVKLDNHTCYKIDIFGRSTGVFDFLIRIRDNWGTYFDTTDFISRRFYRYIEEGKYRKNEIVDFDQEANVATVSRLGKKTKELKKTVDFDVPKNCHDMVSGYYYLRTLDYSEVPEGSIFNLKGFFDDKIYDFDIKFKGREVVKTKLGKIKALVFVPIMPENSLFDGEDSIELWLSDDKNKIPLKVRAKMFVGAVELDIKSVSNLKYEFSPIDD